MSATELEIRVTAEMREIRAALAQLTGQIDQVNQRAARSAQGGRQLASSLQASAIQGKAAATATEQVRQNIAGAVAQSTICRKYRSITAARNSQPSQVRI